MMWKKVINIIIIFPSSLARMPNIKTRKVVFFFFCVLLRTASLTLIIIIWTLTIWWRCDGGGLAHADLRLTFRPSRAAAQGGAIFNGWAFRIDLCATRRELCASQLNTNWIYLDNVAAVRCWDANQFVCLMRAWVCVSKTHVAPHAHAPFASTRLISHN